MNSIISKITLNVAMVLAVVAFVSFAPTVKAVDMGEWVDMGFYDMVDTGGGGDWVDMGYYDMEDDWVDMGYYDMESYDYPSYGSGSSYGSPSYKSPSYSTPSYKPSQYKPAPAPRPGQPSQHCVNHSCNNEVINNTNINTNIHESFNRYGNQESYSFDICLNLPGYQQNVPMGYYQQGGNCFYQQYNQHYPTPQPYVSLSAVPYTGLELGPMGTALYWGFLVLWCAVAAYLIAVKKVQNSLVKGVSNFLFPATVSASVSHAPSPVVKTETKVSTSKDGIDPFIASQLNKYR